jgi:EmrB/QacA subfamily drug resistance transporter
MDMNPSPVGNARKWMTLAIGCVAVLVPNVDMTALNLAIPNMIKDLDPSATQILWIADVYGFALAGLLITMGSLGDRIGHKRLLLIGTVVFAAASGLTAYASSPAVLIGARALLGIAGATLMPSMLSLIRRVFTDPKERTMAVGVFAGVGALGVGLGPIIGGALLENFWWGSVFLINIPTMALVFVAGAIVLPESRNLHPRHLDLPSVPLSIVGVLGIVYAITESTHGGFGQAQVAVALVLGIVGLALFIWRQTRLSEPLIDIQLFRNAAFSASIGTNLFAMFALVAQSLIFSQYFQQVLGWSPLKSGLAGIPGAISAMVGGAALAPPLINLLGRARVVAIGMAAAAGGFAIYSTVGTTSHYLVMLAGMAASGIGVGMALTVTSDSILASVPKERSGTASAISETATELGGALGLAVLGSILNASYRSNIQVPADLPAKAVPQVKDSIGTALESTATLPGRLAGEVVGAAQHAYVSGMHVALWCSATMALAVAATALFTLRSVPKVIPEHLDGVDDLPVAPAQSRG